MPDGGLCLIDQVPDALIPHKTFTGNRPSSSIMLPDLSAYTTGQILALYEHVTAAMVRVVEFHGKLDQTRHEVAVYPEGSLKADLMKPEETPSLACVKCT